MATMNFSVSDDLKTAFNATFQHRNKSAIVAALMREAIERELADRQSRAAVQRILDRRSQVPVVAEERIRAARLEGRP